MMSKEVKDWIDPRPTLFAVSVLGAASANQSDRKDLISKSSHAPLTLFLFVVMHRVNKSILAFWTHPRPTIRLHTQCHHQDQAQTRTANSATCLRSHASSPHLPQNPHSKSLPETLRTRSLRRSNCASLDPILSGDTISGTPPRCLPIGWTPILSTRSARMSSSSVLLLLSPVSSLLSTVLRR